jgi:putative addiction module killer protein
VTTKLSVREYLTDRGVSPFREWLTGLDVGARARIQARVLRFETGNLGDHHSVGDGVWEARCDFGPGYRIFRRSGSTVVLCCRRRQVGQRADIMCSRLLG